MKRLLVTTDLSELSKFAFATAKELADSLNAGIVLLYIVEHEALLVAPPYGYIPVDIIREHEEKAIAHATEELAKIQKTVFDGLTVKCVVEKAGGMPIYSKVCQKAREQKVDYIVASTHGRSGIERLLIGSIAERIVREAPCPVVLVPAGRSK